MPTVADAFGVCIEEAEQYIMSNCGEYSLDHRSISSPNGSINYSKAFEVTLFNGIDPVTGIPMGIKTVEFTGFIDITRDVYTNRIIVPIYRISYHVFTT